MHENIISPQLPTFEEIANSIEEISKAMKIVDSTRLTRKAIVTLIHANSRVPKRDIEIVLNNLQMFDRDWLKSKPVK